jgi:DNA-binding NarL/FixJ family response regulator
LKNAGREELLHAIKQVHEGNYYYGNEILKSMAEPKQIDQTAILSKREIEIINLIAEELTTQEIAEKLFISPHTVDTHRKNLLAKLNVRNTAGIVKFALQNHLNKS